MNSHTPAFVKHLLPFFLILLLALFAFAFLREPKPIAHEGILPEQELSETGACLLEVDVPREIELNLPEIQGLSAELSAPEGVTAAYAEGRLTLSAAQVGEFPLEITLSARGYENLTLSLPLTVRPHEMELSLLPVSDGIPADWTPDTAVSLWSVAADPAEEWPAWSQPVGAHDAYAAGDKVSHNGKHWTSSVDNNVWEPGVYGWTEATE